MARFFSITRLRVVGGRVVHRTPYDDRDEARRRAFGAYADGGSPTSASATSGKLGRAHVMSTELVLRALDTIVQVRFSRVRGSIPTCSVEWLPPHGVSDCFRAPLARRVPPIVRSAPPLSTPHRTFPSQETNRPLTGHRPALRTRGQAAHGESAQSPSRASDGHRAGAALASALSPRSKRALFGDADAGGATASERLQALGEGAVARAWVAEVLRLSRLLLPLLLEIPLLLLLLALARLTSAMDRVFLVTTLDARSRRVLSARGGALPREGAALDLAEATATMAAAAARATKLAGGGSGTSEHDLVDPLSAHYHRASASGCAASVYGAPPRVRGVHGSVVAALERAVEDESHAQVAGVKACGRRVVHGRARSRSRSLDRARTLALSLARSRAHACALALSRSRSLVRAWFCAHSRARARALSRFHGAVRLGPTHSPLSLSPLPRGVGRDATGARVDETQLTHLFSRLGASPGLSRALGYVRATTTPLRRGRRGNGRVGATST